MDALLDLHAASTATGQPVRRLRTWCATGRLVCERDGRAWKIPLSQLPRVAVIAAERDHALARGRAAAAIVPVTTTTPDLGAEIARRLGIPLTRVTMSTLALDGREYLMAVWRASGDEPADLEPLVELVEQLGGDVLDGEVTTE
jgi:hypothetical protein